MSHEDELLCVFYSLCVVEEIFYNRGVSSFHHANKVDATGAVFFIAKEVKSAHVRAQHV